MPTATRAAPDGKTLRNRLSALRRRLRLVATLRGVGWLLTVVLAATAAAGVLDWARPLPPLVRALILVTTLGGGGYVAYRYLLRPLGERADDLTLALRVEERFPSLNDALASAVEFLEQGGESVPGGPSPGLRREAVRRALGKAQGFDFNRVVDSRGLRVACLAGAACCALAVTLLALFPGAARTALVRLANPFGGNDWPTKTLLELENPRLRVGRGEPYEVRGRVRGVIPPNAQVTFRFEGFPGTDHQVEVTREADGTGRFAAHLEPSRVQRSFFFQVRANDAVSPEYAVTVLPPPVLAALDGRPSPQVRLHYPAYTDLPSPKDLAPGTGNIEAVTGTVATLRAAADRPLRRAWIEYQPEVRETPLAGALAPYGAGGPLAAVGLFAAGRLTWETEPAVLDADHRSFTVTFRPRFHGMYLLHLEDDAGLHGSRLFELRLKPDPAPSVQLERPSPTRDVLTVLPDAELALEVIAEDTQYALRSVFVEYRTRREDVPRTLSLYDHQTVRSRMVPAAGIGVLAATSFRPRPTRLEFSRPLPLRSLRHPDGSTLREGDVVILQACADDFDDVSIAKQPGRSHEVEIRIVGRSEMDLVLTQEQAKVQQDLVRLREKEGEAIKKVRAVEGRLKKLKPEDLDQLLQAEEAQQQIRERVGNHKEGLRAEVARILETVRQNHMESSGARDRMKPVLDELDRLAATELQQIEPRLTNARKLAELLDDKAREERRALLRARARDAEREAEKAAKEAGRKEAEAARAEKAEAQRLREQAAEQRRKAQELKQQAERDRREAEREPSASGPKEALTDARKGQEEVEKTLNDLLTNALGPFTHTQEIKAEAHRLLGEQKQLKAEVEKTRKEQEQKGTAGKQPESLTPEQRAELENLKDAQQRLEERTRQLLTKMDKVAEERKEKDPQTAREVREAAEKAKNDNIEGEMRSAREEIARNNLSNAQDSQEKSAAKLAELARNLEDSRKAELEQLAKKMRQAEKKLAELYEQQEKLQKKVKEANKLRDKAGREAALRKLAGEQRELQKTAREMMDELARLRSQRANEALARADEGMEEAGKELDRGKAMEDKQEEMLDRIDEALEELERARKGTEDELKREQLSRLADVIGRLKDRQESLNAQVKEIRGAVLRDEKWSRGNRLGLIAKANAQKGLAGDTRAPAEKELAGAPVFARMLKRSAEAMEEAAKRLHTPHDPDDKGPLFDEQAVRLQDQALRRLAQVLDAIKSEAEKGQPMVRGGGGGGGGGGGEGGGGGGPQQDDSVPPMAQIKLLRSMQEDINKRTEAFKKDHPDLEKLDEKGRAELGGIRRDQKDVAELVETLTRPAAEPGADEGDKK